MSLKLITPPNVSTGLCVTVADAKLSCRFDPSDLDADIAQMILDGQTLVDHEVGVCLMAQTWEAALDAFPDAITLTRTPVASVTSITYIDAAGVLQTLSPAAYVLDSGDAFGKSYIVPAYGESWPETRDEINAVKVRYVVGYADAASVPSHLKRQVLINVAKLIANPDELADRLAAISKVYVQ